MKTGGPAFPGEKNTRFGQPNDCNEGMTLRDYFAVSIIQRLITPQPSITGCVDIKVCVELAYKYATAMMEEREKDNGTT